MAKNLLVAYQGQPQLIEKLRRDKRLAGATYFDLKHAAIVIEEQEFHALVIVTNKVSTELSALCEKWNLNVGLHVDGPLIICEEPHPQLISEAFEYGIDLFCAIDVAIPTIQRLLDRVNRSLSSPAFAAKTILGAVRAIRTGHQVTIASFKSQLAKYSTHDVYAAFALGRVYESLGDFAGALKAYDHAMHLDRLIRRVQMNLSECLLLANKREQAIAILENLEAANRIFAPRKAFLAMIRFDAGQLDAAQKLLEEAKSLDGSHPRVVEAEVCQLLSRKDLDGALHLTKGMSEAGSYFAAKLNEYGIHLSQANQGADALRLYESAHSVVRPELRYKISLNAALAAYRLQRLGEAKRLMMRCEQEFGGPFDKTIKLKQALSQAAA